MITCLLLAAGSSSRFGSPKALVNIQGKNLLVRQSEMLFSAGIEQIVIVLGAHAEQIRPAIATDPRIKAVYNEHFQQGQTSSVKAGIFLGVPAGSDFLLLPVDFPFVLPGTVSRLNDYFQKNVPLVLIPAYDGRKGHPPVFSHTLRNEILQLDNSLGLNKIIHRHQAEVHLLPVQDKGVLATFNTPEELTQIQNQFT